MKLPFKGYILISFDCGAQEKKTPKLIFDKKN